MRLPREAYPIHDALTVHLPTLRPAQVRGLTWWVYGAILAGSACFTAILVAVRPLGGGAALHQQLREWLYDGQDKAVPSPYQVEVAPCFPGLLRWLLQWWQGRDLPLALDATMLGNRLTVLSLSVLYRGTAVPVAWHVLPANRPGAWGPCWQDLLDRIAPAIPPTMRVLLLTDRGLWSPRLWDQLRTRGFSPRSVFAKAGGRSDIGWDARPGVSCPAPGNAGSILLHAHAS